MANPEDRCQHCDGFIGIRNLSGYCDHLYYPDNCDICRHTQKNTTKELGLTQCHCGAEFTTYKELREHPCKTNEEWKKIEDIHYGNHGVNCCLEEILIFIRKEKIRNLDKIILELKGKKKLKTEEETPIGKEAFFKRIGEIEEIKGYNQGNEDAINIIKKVKGEKLNPSIYCPDCLKMWHLCICKKD